MPIIPLRGAESWMRQREVVGEFEVGGFFEGRDGAALGIDAGEDVADGAVLAGGVHGLEDDEDGVPGLGVSRTSVELGEFLEVLFDLWLGVLPVFVNGRCRRGRVLLRFILLPGVAR